MIISSAEISSQEQLVTALEKKGFRLTQPTLSRDLKLLKVAKSVTASGKYAYVLPAVSAYKRVSSALQTAELKQLPGFVSIRFSGNMCVIKTKPGYAGSIAYNIDRGDIPYILGTVAGDDTILMVIDQNASERDVVGALVRMATGTD